MAKVFDSKRDGWIVVLIWAGALGCLIGATSMFAMPAAPAGQLVAAISLAVAGAFMLWLPYSIRYTITDTTLVIRAGPIRYRVPLAEIESVTPTRNPLSSPAASLDRLMIRYVKGPKRVMISPEPRKDFLRELDKRCAQLRLEGDRMVSAVSG